MARSLRAGLIAVAAIAVGIGLSGCGSDTASEPSTPKETSTSASEAAATTTSEAAPTTSAQAAGSRKTLVDYVNESGIVQTPIHRGDVGAPRIVLPIPPGWADAGNRTPGDAYSEMIATDPAFARNPPTIIALVSKLAGNVDPAKILEFAPGEIQNLPGYEGAEEGSPSTLGGFDATQIGGTYTKDGAKRVIARKTVAIPGQDGLYVLQLNADGTEDQVGALMDATSVIDEQTTITP
ncbi:LpqN/LpqT family lipoprotein [Mycobacterium sp. NPDC048908]|uniref:LpqN/LpqT family lipoprotein n=1 Tax=Mycobacterium sp. NPDC048908 TaxID=3364292 RepID=UPI00371D5B6A